MSVELDVELEKYLEVIFTLDDQIPMDKALPLAVQLHVAERLGGELAKVAAVLSDLGYNREGYGAAHGVFEFIGMQIRDNLPSIQSGLESIANAIEARDDD